jgi:hypothetical protein
MSGSAHGALITDGPMLGAIPNPPGEGGKRHPQSSDWPSISEAGCNGVKLQTTTAVTLLAGGYG